MRRQALLVSAALIASNAASYVFTIVAARLLVPSAFGQLSALMAVLVVGVVPAISIQTGVALHVAARTGQAAALGAAGSTRGIGRAEQGGAVGLGLVLGTVVAAVALAAVPALTALLHLPGPAAALALPAALLPFPVVGALSGVLQGRQRFGALAALLGLETAVRSGGALAGLIVGRTPAAALVGVAAGMAIVTVAGWVICGSPLPARPSGPLVRRVTHAAYATVGLVLLINLDVILARNVLPDDRSGVYAVGFIVAKVAYWLPQAVGVIVLPRLVDPGRRRATLAVAALAVLVIDAPVVLAGAAFGPDLLPLLGGARYGGEVAPLWLFGLTGTLLAIAQLLLFSRVASGDVRSILAVWLAIGAEAVLVRWWLHGSVTEVAGAAAAVAALLVVAGCLVEVGSAGYADRGRGDPGADRGQHGGLGDGPVGPLLTVAEQAPGDRHNGRDEGATERDAGERPRIQLPHQRTGDEHDHRQHTGQRGDQGDGQDGEPVAARGRRRGPPGPVAQHQGGQGRQHEDGQRG
jgi:O-antigen/teichoic acid export membrane protein